MEWVKYEASLAGYGESNRVTAETRRARKKAKALTTGCTEDSLYLLP
jgi:hypothetical protein